MILSCRFKSLDHSDALAQYAEERFSKITKFELKPVRVNVTFRAERHQKWVEVYLFGMDQPIRAKSVAEDFYEALDKAIAKVTRQMNKKKQKVQKHKNWTRSNYGKIERLNAQLEYNPIEVKKVS